MQPQLLWTRLALNSQKSASLCLLCTTVPGINLNSAENSHKAPEVQCFRLTLNSRSSNLLVFPVPGCWHVPPHPALEFLGLSYLNKTKQRLEKCYLLTRENLLSDGLSQSHALLFSLFTKYFLLIIFHFSFQKPESNEQRQNGLKMVDQAIWSKKMSNGTRRIPVSPEQVQSIFPSNLILFFHLY